MKNAPIKGYGKVALRAVDIYLSQKIKDPGKAWDQSIILEGKAHKGCAKGAFLTLCAKGYIKYISKGEYDKALREVKDHTLFAIKNIKLDITDFTNHKKVWDDLNLIVSHQGEIDIIYALYKNDLLVKL